MTQLKPDRAVTPTGGDGPVPSDVKNGGGGGTIKKGTVRRLGDRVFQGLSTGSGALILVILALVAAFLHLAGTARPHRAGGPAAVRARSRSSSAR